MKRTYCSITGFLLLSMLWLSGCGTVKETQYVPPTYKTTDNVLGIVKLDDARPPQQAKDNTSNPDVATKALLEVAKSSSAFREVRFSDKKDPSCNLILSGKIKNYKVDYSMTALTWLPDALVAGIGIAAGVSAGKDLAVPVALISMGIAGLDFLVNGLGGKREYNHAYVLDLEYEVADTKTNKVIASNVARYTLTLRFTHFQFYFQSFSSTDVDAISTYAYDYIARAAAEEIIDDLAKRVGSERLMGVNDEIKMYPSEQHVQIGSIEFDSRVRRTQ
jgi:hypothetical protein